MTTRKTTTHSSHSIADEVAAAIKPLRTCIAWYDRVDSQHRPLLDEILAGWQSGRYGERKSAAARAIASVLKARRIADVKEGAVASWLEKHA